MILLVRTLARVALALATLAAGSAFAASQMHKCVEGGRTVYQQQACSVSPASEQAASAPRAADRASDAADAGSAARKLRRPSPAASTARATPR